MLNFVLGFIVGLIIATLVVATLTYFHSVIEERIEIIGKQIESARPKPQGFIYEPQRDASLIRESIIEKNRKEGRDTRMEELL